MKTLSTVFKKLAANFKSIFSLISIISMLLSTFAFITPSAQAATSNGRYKALTPARISDTRPGSGYPNMGQTLGSNVTLAVQMAGKGGIPASGATAAVVNITAASATAESYLTVYPSGTSRPNTSVVNTKPSQIANNQVTVKLGSDGKINIFNALGNTNVIVDVLGYYGDSGHTFVSLAPTRIADTRPGSGQPYAGNTMSGNITQEIQVRGKANVPSTASAVVLNVTIVGPTASGYLTAYPAYTPRPATSNANFVAGEVIAKEMSIKLGDNGSVDLFNGSTGNTNVIVDVLGYYDTVIKDSSNQVYTPVIPERITDTRNASGQINAGQHIGPGGTLEIKTTGGGPSLSEASAAKASALVVNLTVLNGNAVSYLTTYPSGTTRPNSSSINFTPGQLAFNEVTIKLGSNGSFNVFNAFGTADVIVDILGYYSQDPTTVPSGPTTDSTTSFLHGNQDGFIYKSTAYGPSTKLQYSSRAYFNSDRSKIYYYGFIFTEYGFAVMDADGTNVRLIKAMDKVSDVRWSNAASKFVYTTDNGVDLNRDHSIWTMDANGNTSLVVSSGTSGVIYNPRVSPNGSKINYQYAPNWTTPIQDRIINLDGTGIVALPGNATSIIGENPWSPDSTKLTVTREGNIHTINSNGTNDVTVLSNSSIRAFSPTWSPDGQYIAFDGPVTDSSTGRALYTVKPDGTLLKRVKVFTEPDGHGVLNFVWSPDSERLAVDAAVASGPDSVLYTLNRDGSNAKKLGGPVPNIRIVSW